jgi:hypothetical protein
MEQPPMSDFSIELAAERIQDARTKEIFGEVFQAFAVGNYRSAVVMLWTVVICDLIYKLQELRDLYNDQTAKDILDEVAAKQRANPKSPDWEAQLVKAVAERTQLLSGPEFQEVTNLQMYRHLSAHPVLSTAELLYRPNKETVRAYIRNMLEAVLLKPPILSKKIVDNLVEDLAAKRDLLLDDAALQKYLEARYLANLNPEVENIVFRALWKFAFNLSNPDTDANRDINTQTVSILYSRRPRDSEAHIASNQAYFSQIRTGAPLQSLVGFLSKHPRVYRLLTDAAKMPIQALTTQNLDFYAISWFLSANARQHILNIKSRVEQDRRAVPLQYWLRIVKEAEAENCLTELISLGVSMYIISDDFYAADFRFDSYVEPYLDKFESAHCLALLDGAEQNSQIHSPWRKRAREDIQKILATCQRVMGEGYNLDNYPNLQRRVG